MYSAANSDMVALGDDDDEDEDDEMGHGDYVVAPPATSGCSAQLVFYTEPGQPDRWLLSLRRSHLDHSADCTGTFFAIQSQRKKDGRAPLLFRANITLLVRHSVWVRVYRGVGGVDSAFLSAFPFLITLSINPTYPTHHSCSGSSGSRSKIPRSGSAPLPSTGRW
ncbi:MAG: hypothetical protein FJ167_08610 [Gammaproteobacteria bacterium]|nr:hypothetical protein [Gammaproteobacteria bacterium]MBM5801746.1 hypothetical protein [Cyanobacteria bacterium K_DeepCast_35m_m2_023]